MIYYLDNPATLHLLSDKTDVDPDTLPWEQVKRNRDRPYKGTEQIRVILYAKPSVSVGKCFK